MYLTILICFLNVHSGCDINSPRKPGPGGRGGDESKDQSSPLHLCCQWSLQSVVQTLLEHGANVNAWVNNKYMTKTLIIKSNNLCSYKNQVNIFLSY